MQRGEIWWANLREPLGSEPGFRRPVLIISDDALNLSRIQTVLAVCLTTNMKYRDYSGNVTIPAAETGLERDSVISMTQIVTVDKSSLSEYVCELSDVFMERVAAGLRQVMGL